MVTDAEEFVIGAGEVVLLPRNDLHLMGSDLSLPPVAGVDIIHPPKDGGLYSIHHGGGGRRTRMVCGFLGCDNAENNPVISTLPPLLTFNFEQGGAAEWIRSTFQYAAEEITAGRPGSETVMAKLSELLFVEAVRRYAEACRTARPVGSPVCGILTLRAHWRCYTAILPGIGSLMTSAARSACRARHWLTASFV